MTRIRFRWTALGILLILPITLLIVKGPELFRAYQGPSTKAALSPTDFASFLPITLTPPSSAAPVPHFSHIFEIVLENKEYSKVIDNSSMPYLNSLAQQYGLATNYYAIRHPSLPNYIALIGGSTFDVKKNCTDCFIDAPNLVDQLESAGKTWRAYMEGMPSPCFLGDHGQYRQKHNPFIYFDNIRLNPARCNKIVPFTQFAQDLAANNLPNYVWITPDMCSNSHDCPIASSDAWLQTWIPKILASPAWKQNGVLFITYDESTRKDSSGCCQEAAGGHIVTLVLSPLGKPAYRSSIAYDHYSLLGTIEEAWGLPKLGGAACSCAPAMGDFFSSAAAGP